MSEPPPSGPRDGAARLSPWLTPLLDADQQRAADRWAIEERGIPSIALMERAGAGLADVVRARAPAGRVVVVVGKGNNGGDGLVAARRLRDEGREVVVLLLAEADELRGDARANLERLSGPAPQPFAPAALAGAAAVVDAILGTGFSGEPREPARTAIAAINAQAGASVVVACDVPSGVDGSTGEIAGEAVRAHATATFHAAKPGLWISPGKVHAGDIHVLDIGIPEDAPVEPSIGLIDPAAIDEVPRRGGDSTKFAAGAVVVCGGSTGLTGAPSMACESAMRAGAGYVTALVPASLNIVFEQRLLEVMSVPLPDVDGSLAPDALDIVLERAERAGALVLGPGLGREDGAFELARAVAQRAGIALLVDADGLNAHAGRLGSLAGRSAPTVLTPHAGELARLLECDSAEVAAHRLRCARRAAAEAQAIVVLKGDDSIVAAPDGRAAVSRGGAPALATAGTGDVLSGIVGAFLSKRMDPFVATCAGVFVHARAGQLAARAIGTEGVIARDVIELLPRARAAGA
ncbi:MAG TPA: NAD(P)H-hydrate dehydratase [Solirubrobacteraceae bacterium]|jgi:NAD(P)H-hydrate epimerase|nr:NAD(P)H-hydrate dehydratase [Solirubrobacteraceae bacterium]